jgi:hypothetical protein
MVPPLENRVWLGWVEKVVGISTGNSTPRETRPSLFSCQIDDQPDHLVPDYALSVLEDDSGELVFNTDCTFGDASEVPAEIREKPFLADCFDWRGPIAWVPHPATGALQLFWLSEALQGTLERVRSGLVLPSELDPHRQKTLAMAGILVRTGARPETWEKNLATATVQFRERGYAPVAGLIHAFHVSALRRYYRHQVRTGRMILGDGQSCRRYVAHNDGVARFFHHQLAATVTRLAGQPVKPSYVYAASYQEGAKLDCHTDREQCEFSITFCLDYSPEPVLATGWPLQLHTGQGTVTVYQALGDALIYRGRRLPHSRRTLGPAHTSTSIFFHYVREDFSGPLD